MIVLAIGAIFVASLVFFFYLVFGRIESDGQGDYERIGNEKTVAGRSGKDNFLPLKSYKADRKKEVVLK